MNKYIVEFIGTFFLTLVVALTGNPLAIGAVLCAMVYMGGYVSGAHYNPAVTLSVWVRGKIDTYTGLYYVAVQILGAFVGVFAAFWITKTKFFVAPAQGVSPYSVFLVEFLFTFALASVVLNVATSRKNENNHFYGIAIGTVLIAGVFAGLTISGGAYNPAITLGSWIFNFDQALAQPLNIVLYLVAQVLGGLGAGFIYQYTSADKK